MEEWLIIPVHRKPPRGRRLCLALGVAVALFVAASPTLSLAARRLAEAFGG